jgi:hypothetical protein
MGLLVVGGWQCLRRAGISDFQISELWCGYCEKVELKIEN